MGRQVRKYNPGFLTSEELVDSFCVRTSEFDLIVQTLRESTGNSNSHQIVIGPRGSGKTTLLLRVAAEVERDADLRSAWFPIAFAEESYEVATCGEFWLQCLDKLAQQAPREYEQADLRRALEEFRNIQDDRTLADRCLAAILDFADSEGKRLVLIVENLNTLFNDISDPDVGWQLRKTLQDEPRILLLSSATARFEEIDNSNRALYDLFQVHTLKRLTPEACATLWKSVSGRDIDVRVIRSLQILTGGNPRLFVIVAEFGAQLSFGELMKDLLNLVDEHTEYFRSHLESLGPQERRVYLALAVLWKPATAKQVSVRARIPTSQCSSLLGRLVQRGAVVRSGGTRHRREYYLAERMYNIYYLLRTSRGADSVVEALVRFMASYYSSAELVGIRERISLEAMSADAVTRALMQSALDRLALTKGLDSGARVLEHSVDTLPSEAGLLVERARQLLSEGLCDQVIEVCDEVELQLAGINSAEADEHSANAMVVKCVALGRLDDLEAAIAVCDDIRDRYGDSDSPNIDRAVAAAMATKVDLFGRLGHAEAVLEASEAFLNRFEASDSQATDQQRSEAMFNKGVALSLFGQTQNAHPAFDEVIRRFDSNSWAEVQECVARALVAKGNLWEKQQLGDKAFGLYSSVVDRFGSSKTPRIVAVVATALFGKAAQLQANGKPHEALATFFDVEKRLESYDSPELLELMAMAQLNRATLLARSGSLVKAQQVLDGLVDRFSSMDLPDIDGTMAAALVNRGNTLALTDRPADALSDYDQVVKLFGENESPEVLDIVGNALMRRASMELVLGQTSSVIATVGELLDRASSEDLDLIAPSLLMRAEAYHQSGDRTACRIDLDAALNLLLAMPEVPRLCIRALIALAARLGPKPMLELIQESPSERMLLPLATALRRELGIESKVPHEVEEVASDILKDLAMLRQG